MLPFFLFYLYFYRLRNTDYSIKITIIEAHFTALLLLLPIWGCRAGNRIRACRFWATPHPVWATSHPSSELRRTLFWAAPQPLFWISEIRFNLCPLFLFSYTIKLSVFSLSVLSWNWKPSSLEVHSLQSAWSRMQYSDIVTSRVEQH